MIGGWTIARRLAGQEFLRGRFRRTLPIFAVLLPCGCLSSALFLHVWPCDGRPPLRPAHAPSAFGPSVRGVRCGGQGWAGRGRDGQEGGRQGQGWAGRGTSGVSPERLGMAVLFRRLWEHTRAAGAGSVLGGVGCRVCGNALLLLCFILLYIAFALLLLRKMGGGSHLSGGGTGGGGIIE